MILPSFVNVCSDSRYDSFPLMSLGADSPVPGSGDLDVCVAL